MCQVRTVCLCKTMYTALWTNFHFRPFIRCSWLCFESGTVIMMSAVLCRRKNPICLILQAKIWAAQHNLISCVSFSSAPWYSHGNAFLLCKSQSDQRRPFLIWTWKKGRWKGRCKKEVCRGGEKQGSLGNINTWNSPLSHLKLIICFPHYSPSQPLPSLFPPAICRLID